MTRFMATPPTFTFEQLLHLKELIEEELEYQECLEKGTAKMRERWSSWQETQRRVYLVQELEIITRLLEEF